MSNIDVTLQDARVAGSGIGYAGDDVFVTMHFEAQVSPANCRDIDQASYAGFRKETTASELRSTCWSILTVSLIWDRMTGRYHSFSAASACAREKIAMGFAFLGGRVELPNASYVRRGSRLLARNRLQAGDS